MKKIDFHLATFLRWYHPDQVQRVKKQVFFSQPINGAPLVVMHIYDIQFIITRKYMKVKVHVCEETLK
jgi:hypothetical protein